MIFRHLAIAAFLVLAAACSMPWNDDKLYDPGVSVELAKMRKSDYGDLHYNLSFSIPEKRSGKITGVSEIKLSLDDIQQVIIDFAGDTSQISRVTCNGTDASFDFKNEHIIIDKSSVSKGINTISISFTASDQSLNRRDDFLYTLLVPDRARTLFPCFDQPDMKARFALKLEIPASWKAVANGMQQSVDSTSVKGRRIISFSETEPISTYLFSFVTGKMFSQKFTRDGRTISIYHRETNPHKAAQCRDIAEEVFSDLKWMEQYTGIPYPFSKYDAIIVPGFQFGGMEHVGATLYNDSRMFLNENPTLDERLARSVLIAHETTHMWFGDLVTMKWFDDVWTKEVFANFFGSMIAEPHFPQVNHKLNFMLDYIPSAYAEDRTQGTNTIRQKLDNLNDAGLMYGNIIYKKSPVIMNMLYKMMGAESFRKGMREYLKKYSYGNADWEDLIDILDEYTDEDLKKWSHVWCDEKGMPEISAEVKGNKLTVVQKDPWNRGLCWPQKITCAVVSGYDKEVVTVDMTAGKDAVTVELPHEADEDALVIPNIDGAGYGFFRIKAEDAQRLFEVMANNHDEMIRGSLMITLHENLLNGVILPDDYIKNMISYARFEQNELLFSAAQGYIANCCRIFNIEDMADVEWDLLSMINFKSNAQCSLQAFRTYSSVASTMSAASILYNIWKSQKAPYNFVLSESDYISLSYKLAIMMPDKAEEIIKEQQERITNPDRKKEYAFVSPSVLPDELVRDSVFQSLLDVRNRRVEPWASAALRNLNSSFRQEDAVKYIKPALEAVEEIQRTGDIFFPGSWVMSLLYNHNSPEAAAEVDDFFEHHSHYPQLLKNKILQRADHLYRIKEGLFRERGTKEEE